MRAIAFKSLLSPAKQCNGLQITYGALLNNRETYKQKNRIECGWTLSIEVVVDYPYDKTDPCKILLLSKWVISTSELKK